jgi:hypothetical protein
VFPLGQVKRVAFKRNRQVNTLQLHAIRHMQGSRGKVEDSLDSRRHHLIDHRLGMRRGHRDDGNIEPFPPRNPFQLLDVVNRHAAAGFVADLFVCGVEQRGDFESFLPESWIVREREPEIAGADDRDA